MKAQTTTSVPKLKKREHPAIGGAKRAIRRAVSRLKPSHVLQVAAIVETMAYGEDRGRWGLSASYATDQPAHQWKCDAPGVTKGGAK